MNRYKHQVLIYFCLMVDVRLSEVVPSPEKISYVVLASRYDGGWLFVKNRRRGGWEMPAGRPEAGEDSIAAAARELKEETGAVDFILVPVSYYSVDYGEGRKYGRLFCATIERLGELTDHDEIERVKVFRRLPRNISLHEVMSFLFRAAREYCIGQ